MLSKQTRDVTHNSRAAGITCPDSLFHLQWMTLSICIVISHCENWTTMRMKMMTMVGKAPSGRAVACSGDRCSLSSPPQLTHHHSRFAHRRPQFVSQKNPKTKRFTNPLTVAAKAGPPPPSLTSDDTTVSFVGEETVPLEGVTQFEKPNSLSLINKWGCVALLAGGDVLALLIFSAIGRFSHGFSVFDTDTLRTADPFIAGWFLSEYFLGGFGEDGQGMNGLSKAVIAAAKSWSLGIPIGLVIRTTTVGHIPPPNFIMVTMGITAFLLIGWRAKLFSMFPNDDKSKKNDIYRRGSPFELFELLTSLVRRW